MDISSEYFQVVTLSRNEHDNKLWQIHHTTLTIAYNKLDKLCADFNFWFGNFTTRTETVRLTRHDNDWSDLEQIENSSFRKFSLCRAIFLSSLGPISLVRLQYNKWYEGTEEKESELAKVGWLVAERKVSWKIPRQPRDAAFAEIACHRAGHLPPPAHSLPSNQLGLMLDLPGLNA